MGEQGHMPGYVVIERDDWVICKNDAKKYRQMIKGAGYSTDFGLNFIILSKCFAQKVGIDAH